MYYIIYDIYIYKYIYIYIYMEDIYVAYIYNGNMQRECPRNGQCQVTDIIYNCTVLSPDKPNKVYLGTAEGDLKK